MSVPSAIILSMQLTWTKYTYVCDPDECDSLVEYTCGDTFGFPSGDVRNFTCPCGRNMQLVSVEPATIQPTNERNQMETNYSHPANVEGSSIPHSYDANVLVTYKDITDGVVTYPTLKVNELEYKLERIKSLEKQLTISNNQISKVIDNLSAMGWYNPNTDKEDILSELCEILEHEPKQTVRITATLNVEIDYDIPLEDVDDFDAHYFLQDTLSVDAYNGDVIVESWTVEDHSVDWDN